MTIKLLNGLMQQNQMEVNFTKASESCYVTDKYLKSATIVKVTGLLAEFCHKEHFKLSLSRNPSLSEDNYCIQLPEGGPEIAKVMMIRDNIMTDDIEGKKSTRVQSPIEFVSTFSWPSCRGSNFDYIPSANTIPYLKCKKGLINHEFPQFNDHWLFLTFRLAGKPPHPYPTLEEFLIRSQKLLNRFLIKNKEYLKKEYRLFHPNLMFQALSTTVKVAEDRREMNRNHARVLCESKTDWVTNYFHVEQDIHKMEKFFLIGLDWNVCFDLTLEEELSPLLMQQNLKITEVTRQLYHCYEGYYVVQKEDAHYVVSIKTNEDTIERHRFTFDDQQNPVEIVVSPSFFERKFPKCQPSMPFRAERIAVLIRSWGGNKLINVDISKDIFKDEATTRDYRNTLTGKPKGSFVILKKNSFYLAVIKMNRNKWINDNFLETIQVKFKLTSDGIAFTKDQTPQVIRKGYISLIKHFGGTALLR